MPGMGSRSDLGNCTHRSPWGAPFWLWSQHGDVVSQHSRRSLPSLPTDQSPAKADGSGRAIDLQLCHFRAAPRCCGHVCMFVLPRTTC